MLSLPMPIVLANPSESVPMPFPTPPGNSLTSSFTLPPPPAVPTTLDTDLTASPHPDTPLSPPHIPTPPPASLLPPAPLLFPLSTTHLVTRSMTGTSRPKPFHDHHLYYSTLHPLKAFHATALPPKPTTYTQASKIPEWKNAMNLEYNALMSNGT